ncbi:hypothetical protein RCO48_36050 [Peribacillus frigoritolerans]|nr:hypothetical protein [Peribacillus frigoritolerans]
MERKARDSCGKSVAWETPQARRGGSRPRKASAWSGNQRSHFTNPQKKLSANNYYLVCKQKGLYLIKTKVIGTEGTRLLREKRVKGDPRGKRVHEVEIITHTLFQKSEIRSMLPFLHFRMG